LYAHIDTIEHNFFCCCRKSKVPSHLLRAKEEVEELFFFGKNLWHGLAIAVIFFNVRAYMCVCEQKHSLFRGSRVIIQPVVVAVYNNTTQNKAHENEEKKNE
jgi:hypothetical protein